jgi:hypothetical protein
MIQALADAVCDRNFEPVVMKNIFVDKGGELRFAARDIFCFAANARPNGINFVEAAYRPCFVLSHDRQSPGASRTPT